MSLPKEEKNQVELQLYETLKRNPNYKSEDQISAIRNIKKLYNGREKVLKFYNDYIRMISIHGKGLKK